MVRHVTRRRYRHEGEHAPSSATLMRGPPSSRRLALRRPLRIARVQRGLAASTQSRRLPECKLRHVILRLSGGRAVRHRDGDGGPVKDRLVGDGPP
jgi:hypothetical protein